MLTPTKQQTIHAPQADARRVALRSELEATRSAFHSLLQSASTSGWRDRGPSGQWSAGELLVHLTWALEYLPEEVRRARRGQGMFNLPKAVADVISYWYIRWIARRASPGVIGRRYDQAMEATLGTLDTIQADDWQQGAKFYGEGHYTVEDLFHTPARHLAEHAAGLSPAR